MTVDSASLEVVWAALETCGVPLLTRMGLQAPLRGGRLSATVAGQGASTAVVVFAERERWRQVELGAGAEAQQLALLRGLRDGADGIVWDDDDAAVKVAADALTAEGFPRVVRQEFVQDLFKVPLTPPNIDGFALGPFDTDAIVRSRALYVETHLADPATALYTTWPTPPTRDSCGVAFDALVRGEHGAVLPAASFAVRAGGDVVGFVCCIESATPGEATLFDLAVSGVTQGRGLSRLLVRCAQRALKLAGFARMRFYTTGSNLPVQKLFTAEEIVESTAFHARLWRREAHG